MINAIAIKFENGKVVYEEKELNVEEIYKNCRVSNVETIGRKEMAFFYSKGARIVEYKKRDFRAQNMCVLKTRSEVGSDGGDIMTEFVCPKDPEFTGSEIQSLMKTFSTLFNKPKVGKVETSFDVYDKNFRKASANLKERFESVEQINKSNNFNK